MKLTIDRKVWLRGEGGAASKLLRANDGKRCCVGIYLVALGVTDELLTEVSVAHGTGSLRRFVADHTPWLANTHVTDASADANYLYSRNDDRGIEESYRERNIAAIFAKHGVEVEFIDGEATE